MKFHPATEHQKFIEPPVTQIPESYRWKYKLVFVFSSSNDTDWRQDFMELY